MIPEPRSRAQRRQDTELRLRQDVDIWVATASSDGAPYLVPLSFHWDGETVLLATSWASRTVRNLASSGAVRLGLGATRDVCMIDGEAELLEMADLSQVLGDRFAASAGFDPRPLTTAYCWIKITPRRIQAWREENELADRELMHNGVWLAS